jgi:hypothetical protein
MKLVYWCCARRDDSSAYNIRARTKREANKQRAEMPNSYDEPVKVVIKYADAFDLIERALGEGGIGEPYAMPQRIEEEEGT